MLILKKLIKKLKQKKSLALAFFLWGFIFITIIFIVVVNLYFNNHSGPTFYSGGKKVWAHRGYTADGASDNTIASVKKAFALGAEGVEIDIFFDVKQGVYIVSHDYPGKIEAGSTITLSTMFHENQAKGYFWLDLKNLSDLTSIQVKKAVAELERVSSQNNMKRRIVVESGSIDLLADFSDAGFFTLYWISPRYMSFLEFHYDLFICKLKVLKYGISGISTEYVFFEDPRVRAALGSFPVYLFTVNDKAKVQNLIKFDNVKVILTDRNFYKLKRN